MVIKMSRKVIKIILTLFIVSFLTFLLMDIAPGDPAQIQMKMMGAGASEELLEEIREEMGLNDPL